MCLIVATICSNLVLAMGLTIVSRRDYNRQPDDYNFHHLMRSHRSLKSQNEIEDDWKLIEGEIVGRSKNQIKPVSFSNFLKSRSPSLSDEKTGKGRSKATKERKTKKGPVNKKNGDKDDDEEEEAEDKDEADADDDGDDGDDEYGGEHEPFNDGDNVEDYVEMQASSGLDLGVLGQVDELMMVKKNTIIPDGIHFDDSKLLEGNQMTKVGSGSRLQPRRRKKQVKVIHRLPNRSLSRKILSSLRQKAKPQAYVSVPKRYGDSYTRKVTKLIDPEDNGEQFDGNVNSDVDNDQKEDQDDEDFGLTSVNKKVSPKQISHLLQEPPLQSNGYDQSPSGSKSQSKRKGSNMYKQKIMTEDGRKKSPLKMKQPEVDDVDDVDDDLQLSEKSFFDDSNPYPNDYVVVPRSEKRIPNNENVFPYQYNVEIRSRKSKLKKVNPKINTNTNRKTSPATERFKKHEQKEEEHWHEKKWTKTGLFELEQFADEVDDSEIDAESKSGKNNNSPVTEDEEGDGMSSSVKGKRRRNNSRLKRVTKSNELVGGESGDNDDDGHFDIPSKGFRVNKRFIEWTEAKVDLD